MKRFRLLWLIACVVAGCGTSVPTEYEEGHAAGVDKVNAVHTKWGWAGEAAMDVGDETNYVPHDANQSPQFNHGLIDGYYDRRRDVDSRQHGAAGLDNAARSAGSFLENSGVIVTP